MAMAVCAQALNSAAFVPSCFSSVGSAASTDSMSSCLTLRPSSSSSSHTITTGGFSQLISPAPKELSSHRLRTTVKRNSRGLHQPGRTGGSLVGCRASYVGGTGALSQELKVALDNFVGSHKVVLFMKGNRNFPQCGFSNTCIQILNQCQVPYETVNILEDESLRQGVKEYSQWPTYPQLYVDGEFYGGCDITLDAFKSGELKEAIDKAMLS